MTLEELLTQIYERGYLDGAAAVRKAQIKPPKFDGWLKEQALTLAKEAER